MRFKTLLLFFFALVTSSATVEEYTMFFSLPLNGAKSITTDKLGNVYAIVGRQLLQFNSKGKPIANFSEYNSGELRSVDVTNPLKILLFYPDFARLMVLNTKLAQQSIISLQSVGIVLPMVVCTSENGGYWIYDRQDDQLKKLDFNLQVVFQSGSLIQMVGHNIQPKSITESDGFVYMSDPAEGILVFDRYGTYYKTIPIKNITEVQVVEKDLLYVKDNKMFRYNNKTFSENEVILPQHDSIISARIEQRQLYLLTTASMNFYSF